MPKKEAKSWVKRFGKLKKVHTSLLPYSVNSLRHKGLFYKGPLFSAVYAIELWEHDMVLHKLAAATTLEEVKDLFHKSGIYLSEDGTKYKIYVHGDDTACSTYEAFDTIKE